MILTAFVAMVLMHLLYDFHWQGEFIAKYKGESDFILGVHALTWALLLGAVLYLLHSLAVWHIPFLFVTHFIIDRWKARLPKEQKNLKALYIDQVLHLLTIVVVLV